MTLFDKLKEVLTFADYEEGLFNKEPKAEPTQEPKAEPKAEPTQEPKAEPTQEPKAEQTQDTKKDTITETNELVKELIETIKKQGEQKKYINHVVSDNKKVEIKTPDDLVKAYLNKQIKL